MAAAWIVQAFREDLGQGLQAVVFFLVHLGHPRHEGQDVLGPELLGMHAQLREVLDQALGMDGAGDHGPGLVDRVPTRP